MPTDAAQARSALNPWRLAGWGAVAALLLLPWVAMQFTRQVAWTPSDFAFAAGLLIGAGALLELTLWKVRDVRYRAAVGLAILAAVLLIWADGAVGIF